MYLDRMPRRMAVEPADVACRIVEAHELVNRCNLRKRRVDGRVSFGLRESFDVNTHDRSHPGLRPLSGPMA